MTELISKIVSNVGVSQDQAEGGLGAIFSLAKDNLDGDTFSKIAGAVGDPSSLISKFSGLGGGDSDSGIGGMLGSAVSALGVGGGAGNIATMVSALGGLNLDLDTLKKFAPVISGFLKDKGLGDIAGKIDSLL